MVEKFVNAYITDGEHVAKTFGCKNKLLAQKLLQKLAGHLDYLDDEFEDQLSENKSAKHVLLDIINGKAAYTDLPLMYMYIYEKIVLGFGEQIYAPSDDFNEKYFKQLNLESHLFMPVPMVHGLPIIHSIEKINLLEAKEYFLGAPAWKGATDEEYQEAKADFEFAFNKAIEADKDLVFSYY
jgi:hypothetical protein